MKRQRETSPIIKITNGGKIERYYKIVEDFESDFSICASGKYMTKAIALSQYITGEGKMIIQEVKIHRDCETKKPSITIYCTKTTLNDKKARN
jgi:hypothetical protein